MKHRYLTQEEIQEAKQLRQEGMSKRMLAKKYEVGGTTIWEHVFNDNYTRPKRIQSITYIVHRKHEPSRRDTKRCPRCTKIMTRENNSRTIALNLQIADRCITCYLRSIGLEYVDLIF